MARLGAPCLGAGFFLIAWVPSAFAAEPAPTVQQPLSGAIAVEPGATCLEQERVEAQVEAWLARDRVASDVRIQVQGDAHDPRVAVFRILRAGRAHERRFDRLPEACEDATAVVGLAIALAIDASALGGVFAPPAPRERLRSLAAVEATAGLEVLPGASLGATGGVEIGVFDWLGARLEVTSQVSWNNSIEGTSGVFDAVLAAAGAGLCAGGPVSDRVRLELCSEAVAGVMRAQGRGFAAPRAATGSWITAEGGLRVVIAGGLPWVLDLDGVFPLHVPQIRAEASGGTALYREPSSAGASISLGPVFFF